MKLLIINGPNINLLGKREPGIYGTQSFEDFFVNLQFKYKDVELSHFQSNVEGELVTKLQDADTEFDGIILNAAAYTHTSIAIGDAVKGIMTAVVEVHISNTFSREEFVIILIPDFLKDFSSCFDTSSSSTGTILGMYSTMVTSVPMAL